MHDIQEPVNMYDPYTYYPFEYSPYAYNEELEKVYDEVEEEPIDIDDFYEYIKNKR